MCSEEPGQAPIPRGSGGRGGTGADRQRGTEVHAVPGKASASAAARVSAAVLVGGSSGVGAGGARAAGVAAARRNWRSARAGTAGSGGSAATGGTSGTGGSGGTSGSGGMGGTGGAAGGCGANLLPVPDDPTVRGPWDVGVRTVTIGRMTVEDRVSGRAGQHGGQTRGDLRHPRWLPPQERSKVPDATLRRSGRSAEHLYRDVPIDAGHGPYPVSRLHSRHGFVPYRVGKHQRALGEPRVRGARRGLPGLGSHGSAQRRVRLSADRRPADSAGRHRADSGADQPFGVTCVSFRTSRHDAARNFRPQPGRMPGVDLERHIRTCRL